MSRPVTFLLLVIIVVFAVLQFFRPAKNVEPTGFKNILPPDLNASADVQNILEKSCFDCHSNHTNYPWYSEIQPVGWFLNKHISEGKEAFNFSEFKDFGPIRRRSKFESVLKQIQQDKMPLPAYIKLHPESKMNNQQKKIISQWIKVVNK
ncbi:cytochrome C [Chryseobacterium taklimakanense]|uniref:heme-binding domain-containing protein n=1 Tax=Chryseobacterium taklimakanense TaxID=536441 RepID=UPI000F5F2FBE|nr:heme-binding domain-containing protein [Chryseobacterium taklimakanense]AZI22684.1 cytochrome C [Chryseobacterium taklimakanense]